MMIEPPTGSPSTIEMALAARRMRTRGLAKKRRKRNQRSEARLCHQAVWAMETQSLFRLGGSQSGRSCFEQDQQVPQGDIPEAVQRLVRISHAQPPLEFYMLSGLDTPRAGKR